MAHLSTRNRRSLFGGWLKAQREAIQLTQLDLARQLKYENPQIISNIERGFSALPAGRVHDFANALNCDCLEVEIRRAIAIAKDAACIQALESVLEQLPMIAVLVRPDLDWQTAVEEINLFRESKRLPKILIRQS